MGFNLLRSNLNIKSIATPEINKSYEFNSNYFRESKIFQNNIGLNYKYAFNFNNFFIAPEIGYESIDIEDTTASYLTKSNGNNTNFYFLQNLKLKNAINMKSNFGYDLNDKFAFYFPLGISRIGYDVISYDNKIISSKTGNKFVALAGFGLYYEPTKNWVLNLEYNKYHNFKIKSLVNDNSGKNVTKVNLNLIKFGLSYRF